MFFFIISSPFPPVTQPCINFTHDHLLRSFPLLNFSLRTLSNSPPRFHFHSQHSKKNSAVPLKPVNFHDSVVHRHLFCAVTLLCSPFRLACFHVPDRQRDRRAISPSVCALNSRIWGSSDARAIARSTEWFKRFDGLISCRWTAVGLGRESRSRTCWTVCVCWELCKALIRRKD